MSWQEALMEPPEINKLIDHESCIGERKIESLKQTELDKMLDLDFEKCIINEAEFNQIKKYIKGTLYKEDLQDAGYSYNLENSNSESFRTDLNSESSRTRLNSHNTISESEEILNFAATRLLQWVFKKNLEESCKISIKLSKDNDPENFKFKLITDLFPILGKFNSKQIFSIEIDNFDLHSDQDWFYNTLEKYDFCVLEKFKTWDCNGIDVQKLKKIFTKQTNYHNLIRVSLGEVNYKIDKEKNILV
jgi:hypothetical protein